MAEQRRDGDGGGNGNGGGSGGGGRLGMGLARFLFEELARYDLIVAPTTPTPAMVTAGVAAAEKNGAPITPAIAEAIYRSMITAGD